MNIQLMSDLHLEMHADRGHSFLKALQPAAEILVLAGDIVSAKTPDHATNLFAAVSKKFKHVVYVPGNHEFYGTNLTHGWNMLRRAAKAYNVMRQTRHANIHLLDNQAVTLDDVKFYGGTGWFPRFDGDPQAVTCRVFMNDFKVIKNLEPACYLSNTAFAKELDDPDVVVSHHLPVQACVSPQYQGSPMNAFFVSQFDVAAFGAKLWLHGHTHEQTDLTFGETRIIANPMGYPREMRQQAAFQEALVLTV